MIIAVDGTLASGKGTLAKGLARHFGLAHLDTGLLYRATGYIADQKKIDLDDASLVSAIAKDLDLAFVDPAYLRTERVGALASKIATHPEVRNALFNLQRDFANQDGGAVLDGRDIGTVICPHADVKFWIDADPRIRAERRHKELLERGVDTNIETVMAALLKRDENDRNRKVAPLICAEDTYKIDSSDKTANEILADAVSVICAMKSTYANYWSQPSSTETSNVCATNALPNETR